ncbi:Hypothetical protein I595_313 [Croceitalea dokdonensis DOKDO 023]|uniref:Uncharacterized protein n=2 Tax=Croceitalea TaxID=574891 RepID=A0A0P7B271_9FLAO|nr:Hypothetical protein I595_313 [Croceitalea dokdonensis DOKDO 023]
MTSTIVLAIVIFVYLFFFTSKELRFSFAEKKQGLFLSQQLFKTLIFQYPAYSDAYFEKSVAFNKRGEYAEGFYLLNKAVEINPEAHLGYRGWLKLYKLKDFRGALLDFKRLDALTPNVIDAPWGENIYYLKGLSYNGLGQYKEAIIEFNKNIITESDSSWIDPKLFLHKGIALKELGDNEYALDNLNVCLNHTSNSSAEAFYQKGIVLKNLKQFDSSLISFRKSKQLFEKGRKIKDFYNEIPNELYLADILKEISSLDE